VKSTWDKGLKVKLTPMGKALCPYRSLAGCWLKAKPKIAVEEGRGQRAEGFVPLAPFGRASLTEELRAPEGDSDPS
jgi:hypothetical protein